MVHVELKRQRKDRVEAEKETVSVKADLDRVREEFAAFAKGSEKEQEVMRKHRAEVSNKTRQTKTCLSAE
eukprot:2315691-Pyramimonas_sp.AAC.1